MPVLGPEFQTFEYVNNVRQQMIEAKERSAVHLAHSLLEAETELSRTQRFAQRLGTIITGRRPDPARRETPLAFYEPNDDASEAGEVSMAAFFSNVAGGCLFTRPVLEGSGPIERRLGPLQPRAVITKNGYFGYPVVALNEEGNEVFPSTMTLDDREDFINEVMETLTIIGAQAHTEQSNDLKIRA